MEKTEFFNLCKGKRVLVSCNVLFHGMRYPAEIPPAEKLAWYQSHVGELSSIRERTRFLSELKRAGCQLVLWSNRSEDLRELTESKLAKIHALKLFDELLFCDGNKKADKNDFIVESSTKQKRYQSYQNALFLD